jgi:hypothetical protein
MCVCVCVVPRRLYHTPNGRPTYMEMCIGLVDILIKTLQFFLLCQITGICLKLTIHVCSFAGLVDSAFFKVAPDSQLGVLNDSLTVMWNPPGTVTSPLLHA